MNPLATLTYRDQSICLFMAKQHGWNASSLTEEQINTLLQDFEDSEEYQTAYRCMPLTAQDFKEAI